MDNLGGASPSSHHHPRAWTKFAKFASQKKPIWRLGLAAAACERRMQQTKSDNSMESRQVTVIQVLMMKMMGSPPLSTNVVGTRTNDTTTSDDNDDMKMKTSRMTKIMDPTIRLFLHLTMMRMKKSLFFSFKVPPSSLPQKMKQATSRPNNKQSPGLIVGPLYRL